MENVTRKVSESDMVPVVIPGPHSNINKNISNV